jgi:HAD superfamily hydrolase (TIGR01450 family)
MVKLKNLADVSKEEQAKFVHSFNNVFVDLDGVVWHTSIPIPGAAECTNNLKKIGKNIKYVSNNTVNSPEGIADTLKRLNHDVDSTDVINPIVSIISYFKSIQFKDEIFLIGSQALRDKLAQAGFNIVPEGSVHTQNTFESILEHYEENPKIKAVVFELDFTLDYLKLQKCIWYLKQPDCKFVVGMDDKFVPIGTKGPALGWYYFIEGIKAATGKEPIRLAKPSKYFVDLIKLIFKITDPNKVLMIGDTTRYGYCCTWRISKVIGTQRHYDH